VGWTIPFTVVLCYLLGSIPSAYIVGHLVKGIDIREVGDRNMGAANTFREIGPWAGITVGAVDISKGALAVLVARWASLSDSAVLLTGLAAVVGHNWPVALQFRGGRGVSTTVGVLLMLMPRQMFILLAAGGMCLFATRNVILTCAIIFAPLSLVAWWLDTPPYLIAYGIALPCLVGFTHFITTRKLPAGSEGRTAHANNGN